MGSRTLNPARESALRRRVVVALWASGLLGVATFCAIAWYLAPLAPSGLVLQFSFTPAEFGFVIHSWPAEHLARYRAHFAADFVLLLSYGAFGYLLAARTKLFSALAALLQRSGKWALPLAAVFDATENVLHLWLTEVPRFGYHLVYFVSASCSVAKWLLFFAFGFLVLVSLVQAEE